MNGSLFSDELEQWLTKDGPKTLGALDDVFAEKTFAVAIIFLMFIPALPIPTGGVTHLFEVITVVLGIEMVLGLRTVWLPSRWRHRELGGSMTSRALPFMIKRIRFFERFSRPRMAALLNRRWFIRVLGAVVVGFAVGAAFAPPFSGLDTLPAMGAVALALGIVLEDIVVVAIGFALGVGGVALILTVGAALMRLVRNVV